MRNFTSELVLDVYKEDRPAAFLGNTLDEGGISVPAQGGWFIRPVETTITPGFLAELAAEVTKASVPGLSFAGSRTVDDALLAGLAGAPLVYLDLFQTVAGEQGLPWLVRLPSLQRLSLAGTRVTDDALAAIAARPELQVLDLGWTDVTDRGLEHLRAHPGLVSLSLRSTRVSDRGLDAVATIPRLRELDLQETKIRDASIARLRPLARSLEQLWLGYTSVTNRCIADLTALEALRTLMLRVTKLGSEHDSELTSKLPNLGIIR